MSDDQREHIKRAFNELNVLIVDIDQHEINFLVYDNFLRELKRHVGREASRIFKSREKRYPLDLSVKQSAADTPIDDKSLVKEPEIFEQIKARLTRNLPIDKKSEAYKELKSELDRQKKEHETNAFMYKEEHTGLLKAFEAIESEYDNEFYLRFTETSNLYKYVQDIINDHIKKPLANAHKSELKEKAAEKAQEEAIAWLEKEAGYSHSSSSS